MRLFGSKHTLKIVGFFGLSLTHPPPQQEDNESFDGSIMSWTLLSFAVITPMSASVGMAFKRRDKALDHLAVLKSTLFNIYSAHACWDWCKKQNPQSGRAASDMNWLDHCDKVLIATIMMCVDSTRMLTLPSASRGRHRVTALGRKEAKTIISLLHKLHQSILDRMTTITDLCEVFKREGLPPNEATRIRQWERMVTEKMGEFFNPACSFSISVLCAISQVVFHCRWNNRAASCDKEVPHTSSSAKLCPVIYSISPTLLCTLLWPNGKRTQLLGHGYRIFCLDIDCTNFSV